MRSVAVTCLFFRVVYVNSSAKELAGNHIDAAHNLIDNVADKVIDRLLDQRLKVWPLQTASWNKFRPITVGTAALTGPRRETKPALVSLAEAVADDEQRTYRNTDSRHPMSEVEGQGAKAWLLGTMQQSDPRSSTLLNSPLLTTLQSDPLVKGVLAVGDRDSLAHLSNGTKMNLGQSLLDMKDQAFGNVKKYGAAGFVSLVVESVLYWVFILVPAAAYMYHTNAGTAEGPWLPTLSDPESVREFGKLLGGAYLFSKIPPIEAARWAWALAMVPWFERHMQPMGSEQLAVVGGGGLEGDRMQLLANYSNV